MLRGRTDVSLREERPERPGSSAEEAPDQSEIGRAQPVGTRRGLVPVGVAQRLAADLVEALDLVRSQLEVGGGQVVAQLLDGAGTHDE